MKAACPSCATVYEVKIGYAGLVKCKCGVRFDSFSHIHKVEPQLGRQMVVATTVQCVDVPFDVPLVEPFGESIHTLNVFPRKKIDRIITALRQHRLIFGTIFSVIFSLVAVVVVAHRAARDVEMPVSVPAPVAEVAKQAPIVVPPSQDSKKIAFSAIEFNSVGRSTYFLQANLTNIGATASAWPVIEVTLLSAGREVGQRLVTPLEYLVSNDSAGKTTASTIAPGQVQQVRMSLVYQDGTANGEDYRVRPVFLGK